MKTKLFSIILCMIFSCQSTHNDWEHDVTQWIKYNINPENGKYILFISDDGCQPCNEKVLSFFYNGDDITSEEVIVVRYNMFNKRTSLIKYRDSKFNKFNTLFLEDFDFLFNYGKVHFKDPLVFYVNDEKIDHLLINNQNVDSIEFLIHKKFLK